ncbi:MAG: hypothetical protein Q8M92_01220 [Candidatus Subteraquimicrobiales bacterium]|nr:hypothetical protein [Candidatus Subteraquimicrobiales bacterium]
MNERDKIIQSYVNNIVYVACHMSAEFEEDSQRIHELLSASNGIEYVLKNGVDGLDEYMEEKER